MTGISQAATAKTLELLAAPAGVNAKLAAITDGSGYAPAPLSARQMARQNVALELAERSAEMQYPAVHVYCERMSNELREKFRTFSGKAQMAIEVRISQDRLEEIDQKLESYVEAVTGVLNQARGDWGAGMFYTGGYEVTFGPVKRGGKNFVQTAKVTFEVEVSRN